ncbi:MAG TPA: metallophosphoesterase [Bryobacteraceae bacterium]|nr:metallophosphoesterase [Bryobacteraceae bacterium]
MVLAIALATLGLMLNLPNASRIRLNPHLFGWLRGAGLFWALTSTPIWIGWKLIGRFGPRPEPEVDPTRRALLRGAGTLAAAVPAALLGFGALVERTAFRVREINIPVPGLHPDLNGLRLVQLSDIHLSAYLSEQEFARVVDAANELRGHIVFVTGDLISVHGDPVDACLRQISRLRSDAGTLGCLGNHEIYAGTEDYTAAQGARLGIPFLRSQARQLRFGKALMNIAGVDYQKMSERPHYLAGAESLMGPNAFNLLLSHNPDVFPVAAQQGWNLTLAGHTHGGQVNVEILHHDFNVAYFYTPYVYGHYRSGPSSIYVTRGIGTIGMPARIGAPPEIAVIRLQKA